MISMWLVLLEQIWQWGFYIYYIWCSCKEISNWNWSWPGKSHFINYYVLELRTGWFTAVGNYLSTLWTTFSDILFTTFVSLYMMERFRTLHDLIKLLSCIGFLNYSFAAASVLSGIHNSQPFLFWLRLASMFLSQFLCRSSHLLALRHLLQAISISMVKYLPSVCNYIFFSFTVVVTCI